MKKQFLFLSLFFLQTTIDAQTSAQSEYIAEKNTLAQRYVLGAQKATYRAGKMLYYYYAACAYSLAGNNDSAFAYLDKSVQNGFNSAGRLESSGDLNLLHTDKRWQDVLAQVRKKNKEQTDPGKITIHVADILAFWNAFDRTIADTAAKTNLFKEIYFDKGSEGLQEYFVDKVQSYKQFAATVMDRTRFYKSVRPFTSSVNDYRKDVLKISRDMKALYEKSVFPEVYFMMGGFFAGGTVGQAGLFICIDLMSLQEGVDISELSPWQKAHISQPSNIPAVIAHELVHYQQTAMAGDTTTIVSAIREGMADFIATMIIGKAPEKPAYLWAKGKEKQVWESFKKDMFLNRKQNWIGNGRMERPDFPADQGYWVGYQICKAYYEEMKDKKQAIYDMMHIQDYKLFVERSKLDEKIRAY
jgi:hypothetical protein